MIVESEAIFFVIPECLYRESRVFDLIREAKALDSG
jgi:hypothetical protein